MIDKIVLDNFQDFKTVTGKVYSGRVEVDLIPGKINKVDPRVPRFFNYLNNLLQLTSWGSPISPRISSIDGMVFKDREEFLTVEITFSGTYKYTLQLDSGYYTENSEGGIFLETLENMAGQELLRYSFLDEMWEKDKVPNIKHQPLVNFGEAAWEYQHILEELRNSFVYLDWSSEILEGTSLRTIRERLQGIYKLSEEYVYNIWSKIIPTLDVGVDRVDNDNILVRLGEDKVLPMSLDCQGSGAKMLFRSLPVLMLDNKTIFISNKCSYFHELHPILRRHLLEDVLKTKTLVLQNIDE